MRAGRTPREDNSYTLIGKPFGLIGIGYDDANPHARTCTFAAGQLHRSGARVRTNPRGHQLADAIGRNTADRRPDIDQPFACHSDRGPHRRLWR